MLYGYQCLDCGNHWACQAGPEQDHRAIITWCPICLPRHVPADPRTRARGVF